MEARLKSESFEFCRTFYLVLHQRCFAAGKGASSAEASQSALPRPHAHRAAPCYFLKMSCTGASDHHRRHGCPPSASVCQASRTSARTQISRADTKRSSRSCHLVLIQHPNRARCQLRRTVGTDTRAHAHLSCLPKGIRDARMFAARPPAHVMIGFISRFRPRYSRPLRHRHCKILRTP